jgi:Uma2 family endonuclease
MRADRQSESTMSETAKKCWTYDDLLQLPDDGNRYEIIDGELYVTPSPLTRHQKVLGILHHLLMTHLDSHPVGECYIAPLDVILSRVTVLEPDLLFISRERLDIAQEHGLVAAPDWVAEVLSPSTRRRDIGVKKRAYAKHGVREYWIVDPDLRRVDVFVRSRSALVHKIEATAGKVASPLVVPGFTVSLAKLFA